MSTNAFFSPKYVSELKREAKRRRATGKKHVEVLDELAREAGLPNWHHVTLAEANHVEAERKLEGSLCVLLDNRVADYLELVDGGTYVMAQELFILRSDELVAWMREAEGVDDTPEVYHQLFEHLTTHYCWIRYVGAEPPPAGTDLVAWFRRQSPWTSELFFVGGKMLDPQHQQRRQRSSGNEPMPKIASATLRDAFGADSENSVLITNSPGTMERYKAFPGPRSAWNWCLHCERAYPQGSYRREGSYQNCPYTGCNGDAVLDLWDWSTVREKNPSYPITPVFGERYPLTGRKT